MEHRKSILHQKSILHEKSIIHSPSVQPPGPVSDDGLLLEGDMQSGGDFLILEGDESGFLLLEGTF